MCRSYIYFCKICKMEMGLWKKSKNCLDPDRENHVTQISTKFHKDYCEDCGINYLKTKVLYFHSNQKSKRLRAKDIPNYDHYKLPECFIQNIPDRPDVLMMVKFIDGSEKCAMKKKEPGSGTV